MCFGGPRGIRGTLATDFGLKVRVRIPMDSLLIKYFAWKRKYPTFLKPLIRQVAGNSGEYLTPTDSGVGDYRILYAIVSKDEILVFEIA